VCFVRRRKQSNIFSLIVTMLNLFGQQYIYPLIFKILYLWCIYLIIGHMHGSYKQEIIAIRCCSSNMDIMDK
jgi:hypothetical protein